jgi:hypothetical protein
MRSASCSDRCWRCPGRRGGLYDFIRRVLATEHGTALYRRRQAIVAPVFGQIKANRGTTHILLKLHRHQLAAG